MKLLIAIVSKADAPVVASALNKEGYPSTMTDGVGGFLNTENTLIFAGVEDKRVNAVLKIIGGNTQAREKSVPEGMEHGKFTLPDKIRVGGASVFVLDLDRFVKL